MRVQLKDRVARTYVDRTVAIQPQRRRYTVEFDAPPGVYHLSAAITGPQCSASTLLYFLPGAARHIALTLADHSAAAPLPTYMIAGTVTPSDAPYARPEPTIFDWSAQCDEPAPQPLHLRAVTQYEAGAYYISLFDETNVPIASQTLTLDLRTPAETHHYVYIPMPFPIPVPNDGWPIELRLDISPALVEALDERTASWIVCGLFRISSSK